MNRSGFAAASLGVLLAGAVAPAAKASASRRTIADSTVELLGYHTTFPSSWSRRAPASSSRLAQFVMRGADASSDAEVVVFFFGASQGGNVEANVARWRSQFSTPDGSPVPETITHDSAAAFPTTIAEFRGTYRRGVGAGSADSVRTGQTLVAAIVETPRGVLFVQLFGPTATVTAHRAELVRFVREIK
jgi:hypothetical protein